MIWQYMVKTADVGIRARDLLIRKVATPMSDSAKRGEEAFNEGGCGVAMLWVKLVQAQT